MNFDKLVQSVVDDTVGAGSSLSAFHAELALCGTIIAILLLKIAAPRWKSSAFYVTVFGLPRGDVFCLACGGSVASVAMVFRGSRGDSARPRPFSPARWWPIASRSSLRVLLLLFALLFTMFTQIAGAYDEEDMTEFYVLMLGAWWACA